MGGVGWGGLISYGREEGRETEREERIEEGIKMREKIEDRRKEKGEWVPHITWMCYVST